MMKKFLKGVGRWIEDFSSSSKSVHLVSALVASVYLSHFEYNFANLGEPQPPFLYYKQMLTAVASFLSVALLVERFWRGQLSRMLPNWILIAVFGSLLYEVIAFTPAMINSWNAQLAQPAEPSLIDFVRKGIDMHRSALIINWLITLPITAAIFYSGIIARVLRHWHNEPEKPLRILGKR